MTVLELIGAAWLIFAVGIIVGWVIRGDVEDDPSPPFEPVTDSWEWPQQSGSSTWSATVTTTTWGDDPPAAAAQVTPFPKPPTKPPLRVVE